MASRQVVTVCRLHCRQMRNCLLSPWHFFLISALLATAVAGPCNSGGQNSSQNSSLSAKLQKCQQALDLVKKEKTECEKNITSAQQNVSQRIAAMRQGFSDTERQLKSIEPHIASLNKSIQTKNAQEAKLYKDLHAEIKSITFLQRHRRKQRNASYDLLIERYLACEDDLKAFQLQLDGCRTKEKTVQMWNAQRLKQYKDKSDVYIMRVSRIGDPVSAKINASNRVSASIARMEQQLQALRGAKADMTAATR